MRFETFSRQWGTQLTAKVRVRSQVTFEGVQIFTYDAYATELPPQTAMVLLDIEGTSAKAVIQFPSTSALSWFTRMLGGVPDVPAEERKFTQVEASMLRRLVEDTVDDLRYSFGQLLSTEITVDSIHHNSQFAQAAATADQMIVARLSVNVGDSTDLATIALPADFILRQLGDANPVTSVTDARGLIQAQLSNVPVDVSLQLNSVNVTPSEILNLAVGDLIGLPHSSYKPLNIAVEGQPLASASVGSNGSRVACVIVDTQEHQS
jgi:Flagellar motor switch protein